LIKKALEIFFDLKRNYKEYKVNVFFKNIESKISTYLKIYIIKPSALVESDDIGFKGIDLYNIKSSSLNNMKFKERRDFYNRVKSKFIHANNCLYFYYVEKNQQPLIFTIWGLGEEIRVGCFINREMDENIFKLQKEKIKKLFKMFETPLFKTKLNEIERNDYFLTEIIITNLKEKSIYDSLEDQNFLAQIFAVVITQNMLEYIENKEKLND